MVSPNQEVARNIAAAITQKNRSKKSVAEEAGIPLTTFNRKIKAQAEITVTDICAVADALGISPLELAPSALNANLAVAV